jgi:nitrogen fixation NifU-like protein
MAGDPNEGGRPRDGGKMPALPVTVQFLSMYSPQVLDHFQHPRNTGEVVGPEAAVQLENPACGDVLKLTLRVVDGRIEEIRFLAQGCVPTLACASLLTELVHGRTIAEARQLRRDELVKVIGGLPKASLHASHLAMDALNAALKRL